MLKRIPRPDNVDLEPSGEPFQSGEWTIQSFIGIDETEYETIYEKATHPRMPTKWFKLVDEE